MEVEVKCESIEDLALQFNEVNAVLSVYEKEIYKMTYKKFKLNSMLTKSKEFKDEVLRWAINNPEEVIPIYFIANEGISYESNLISFGDVVEEGVYCDFCEKDASLVENSILGDMERYTIINKVTGEKSVISLKDMVTRYKKIAVNEEVKNIEVKMGKQSVTYPVLKNEIKLNRDGGVSYGRVYIELHLARTIKQIIDDAFILSNSKDLDQSYKYKNNVVSISKVKNNVG